MLCFKNKRLYRQKTSEMWKKGVRRQDLQVVILEYCDARINFGFVPAYNLSTYNIMMLE